MGEAGIGYVLKEGLFLPPLMFSIQEVEALVLGSQWVKSHADQALRDAANQAMQKITTVIPSKYQQQIKNNTLFTPLMDQSVDIDRLESSAAKVRQAIREEKILTIDYQDGDGKVSQRIIYAFSLAFFDSIQVTAAWCELRKDFRHFRVDRILNIKILNQCYRPTRESLLRLWRAKHYCDLTDD